MTEAVLAQVAHANVDARTQQSIAYFDLQQQLQQPGLDRQHKQDLNDKVSVLTSQILQRLVLKSSQTTLFC